ncbi:A/G-specific adenine glycosylase [hydrothermal vent metagenome]|uniref:Adenine DNA glycosylase n=1 Tax=hydrothermal vent metagenome TaxID=652676 RepID=A0A3B0W7D9_9ZZZZ
MTDFSVRLLDWYQQHGRHDLPWQDNRQPEKKEKKIQSLYRIWISEIMLQQTQVVTVIPYFEKFMRRFPTIAKLAQASQDEILLYWAGLGYYSRARNLYKAALFITEQHKGEFPQTYEEVLALPGIGPSTAGAILAQALGQRHAILDGNVKRVLARYRAVEGWPGQSKIEKQLWQLAEKYTPESQLADYTQAIMDLGATVCTRASAKCDICPLEKKCVAYQTGRVVELPTRKPKKTLPVREKRLLVIRNEQGACLMEKRPPAGIWGGLWSLPELVMEQSVVEGVSENWQLTVNNHKDLPAFRHTFSHFHLDITPCEVHVSPVVQKIADSKHFQWCDDVSKLALAAPVSVILEMK